MAGIRLRAVVNTASRDSLTAGDPMTLVDCIASGDTTNVDAALLAALDARDVAAVKKSAAAFIMVYAAAFFAVAAVTRGSPTSTTGPVLRAADVVKDTTAIRSEHLHTLPAADDLDAISKGSCAGITR